MRRIARYLALPLLAVVVFLVLGEILARAANIVDRLNGYNRALFTHGPNEDVPYVLRPRVETTFLGTAVRVNSLGFRGAEVAPVPEPGVRRVLILGDSVAFGFGVDEDAMLSSAVARHLGEAGGGRYEVINAGIPGADLLASVRLLETSGLALGPQAAVLAVSLNDYDPTPALNPLGILTRNRPGTDASGVLDRSEIALLLRWLLAYSRGALPFQLEERRGQEHWDAQRLERGGDGLARIVERTHLRFYHDPEPAQWDRVRKAVAALGRIAAAGRVQVLVAIFPEQYQLSRANPDLTPQQRLLGLCQEEKLRCVDLWHEFAAAGETSYADVQHPNADGYALAGNAIAAALLAPASP